MSNRDPSSSNDTATECAGGVGAAERAAEADRREVLSVCRRRKFARGEVVFHEGDPGDTLHLIAKGHVAVRTITPAGDQAMIRVPAAGDFFGELAVIAPAPRNATIDCLDPDRNARAPPRTPSTKLRAKHPGVDAVLMQALIAEVRRLSTQLCEALYLPAESRVWKRVADLTRLYETLENDVVTIPLTQEDVADMAGTTRPTANKVLRSARTRGCSASVRAASRSWTHARSPSSPRRVPRSLPLDRRACTPQLNGTHSLARANPRLHQPWSTPAVPPRAALPGRHLRPTRTRTLACRQQHLARVGSADRTDRQQRRTLRSNDTRTEPTTKERSMSTSATLPSTIQIRPSRLAGLLVAVAIVTGVTTWSVSQVTTESQARSSPPSNVVPSPNSATKAYGDGVTALTLEQQAAIYGNVYANQSQQRLDAEAKLGMTLTTTTKPNRTSSSLSQPPASL